MQKILLTGIAGFIGFHTFNRLSKFGYEVIGIDNINDYYSVDLKFSRLNELGIEKAEVVNDKRVKSAKFSNMSFIRTDLSDRDFISKLFKDEHFDYVINLGAQAGVRYSLKDPYSYIKSNIDGFMNILEGCRNNGVKHLIYASSSSVYGLNKATPFSERNNVDHPASLYAATKKSNELMAHTYSHLYNIPTTGLRFFTVYGPWGRPDMAYFSFTEKILKGETIDVYNYGKMKRDFTYIDDITEGIVSLINCKPQSKDIAGCYDNTPNISSAPYCIYNIGNNKPVELLEFIKTLEDIIGKTADKRLLPIQPGDVVETYADIDNLNKAINFVPKISIKDGLEKFFSWYKEYYRI